MILDVVVIGAGSSGMSCALTLQEGGAQYKLVSETLGGRIVYDRETDLNFGAYFTMRNYEHANKLVTRRTWINPFSCRFHDGQGQSFATISLNTLKRLPGFLAFGRAMARFLPRYARFKKNCEYMSQREAMELDPYIRRLFREPAANFIKRNRFTGVAKEYISEFSYACTGVDMETITALDFMNVCQGLVVGIDRFYFDEPAMEARFGDAFVRAKVIKHALDNGIHTVELEDGREFQARNVIFATPAIITADFLGIDTVRDTCQLYVAQVEGKLKRGLDTEEMNLFPFSSPTIFTALQDNGHYLVYSREKEIEYDKLFDEYSVHKTRDWDKAMYVQGSAYLEQQYGDSTYVAGDHNGLGLEPAAISGIYAARQVLKKIGKH